MVMMLYLRWFPAAGHGLSSGVAQSRGAEEPMLGVAAPREGRSSSTVLSRKLQLEVAPCTCPSNVLLATVHAMIV